MLRACLDRMSFGSLFVITQFSLLNFHHLSLITHHLKYLNFPNPVFGTLRTSPADSANFCTVWRMNNDFYLYLATFSNILSNRLSISFKYYFFIHYLLFFLTTTHLPTFFYSTPNYYNRKKKI